MDPETVYQLCKNNECCVSKDDPLWVSSFRKQGNNRLDDYIDKNKGSPFESYVIIRYNKFSLKKVGGVREIFDVLNKDTDRTLIFISIISDKDYELLDDLDNIVTLRIDDSITKKMSKNKKGVETLILGEGVSFDNAIIQSFVYHLPDLKEIIFCPFHSFGSPDLFFQSLSEIPENFHGDIKVGKTYRFMIKKIKSAIKERKDELFRKLEELEKSEKLFENNRVSIENSDIYRI